MLIAPAINAEVKMQINNHLNVNLRHLSFGSALTVVKYTKLQLRCPSCGITLIQCVPFKANKHLKIKRSHRSRLPVSRALRGFYWFYNKCWNNPSIKTLLKRNMKKASKFNEFRCFLAPQRRLERPTLRLGGECSIH